MANIILLYEPKSDSAALTGGSWTAGLPLSNMADSRLWRVARSASALKASTQFRVTFSAVESFKAVVLGPMNVTTAYKYRITTYTTSAFSGAVNDTGWVNPFGGTGGDALDLEWEDPNFWLGVVPFDDEERGVYLIHVYASSVASQYWKIELDDETNSDGHIDIGRLFMAKSIEPTVNYAPAGNGLTFENNSLSVTTLSGGVEWRRRVNPRLFRFAIDKIGEAEAYSKFYPFMRSVGFDEEVFVIPDPDDTTNIQQRSFLGTVNSMDPLAQDIDTVGMGFEIREIV